MKKVFFILLIIVVGWKVYNYSGEVSLGPGVMVNEVPYQKNIKSSVDIKYGDYAITEVAEFRLKAKILAKKNYHFGRTADLSPTDLALGWGKMSDESILDKIKISQSGRFYRWRVESFPIPRDEIQTHSANMHLIPANDSVERAISKVRKGEIIKLSGSLVKVKSTTDNWYWNSSMTRNDTGGGACEVILVSSIQTLKP